jgi:hypothetical protein
VDPLITVVIAAGLLAAELTTRHPSATPAVPRSPSAGEPWSGTEPLVTWYQRNRAQEAPHREVWRPGRRGNPTVDPAARETLAGS